MHLNLGQAGTALEKHTALVQRAGDLATWKWRGIWHPKGITQAGGHG